MKVNRYNRLGRWAIGALMLLLIHGLGMARPARAGCNHLVSSESDRHLGFNQLEGLIIGDSSSSLSDERPVERGPKHRTPCSGPGCSERVPMPTPTTIPDSDRSDQWGVLTALALPPIASPPSRTVDEPADRPAGQKPSVFHPPPA